MVDKTSNWIVTDVCIKKDDARVLVFEIQQETDPSQQQKCVGKEIYNFMSNNQLFKYVRQKHWMAPVGKDFVLRDLNQYLVNIQDSSIICDKEVIYTSIWREMVKFLDEELSDDHFRAKILQNYVRIVHYLHFNYMMVLMHSFVAIWIHCINLFNYHILMNYVNYGKN